MSYILEALRKADAQRERARAPGLHAHPLAAAPTAPARSWRAPALTGALVALGGVAVLFAAWRLSMDESAVPVQQPSEPAIAAAPAAPPTAQAAAAQPAPPEPAAAIVPAAPEPIPRPAETERPAPAHRTAAPAPQAEPGPAPAAVSPAPAPMAAAAPPGAPKLAVTGGVYSQNPAQRMLIVNGQVFNEGSEVASGVRLEEVRPKQAVLNFQGQRFTLPY
jgi:general secretion pathway protein B